MQHNRSLVVDQVVDRRLFLLVDLDRNPARRQSGAWLRARKRRHERNRFHRWRLRDGRRRREKEYERQLVHVGARRVEITPAGGAQSTAYARARPLRDAW